MVGIRPQIIKGGVQGEPAGATTHGSYGNLSAVGMETHGTHQMSREGRERKGLMRYEYDAVDVLAPHLGVSQCRLYRRNGHLQSEGNKSVSLLLRRQRLVNSLLHIKRRFKK